MKNMAEEATSFSQIPAKFQIRQNKESTVEIDRTR
jgi:hypothetical protein